LRPAKKKIVIEIFSCNTRYFYIVETWRATRNTELIVAFPLQKWLGEDATKLCHTCISHIEQVINHLLRRYCLSFADFYAALLQV